MPKFNQTWKISAHSAIEKLAPHLWRVEAPLGGADSPPMQRVMTIAKMTDGKLVIHNAVALNEASMTEIDAWGEVAYIVVPNGYHRLDSRVFKDRYPNAKIVCPRGGRKKVSEVVSVDLVYEEFPKDDIVSFETIDGIGGGEGAMFVKEENETSLVLNDSVFNMPHKPGFTGFVLKNVTGSTGGPKVSRLFRLVAIKDKSAFRAHLERLAKTPKLARVVVSHHQVIDQNPAQVLQDVAASV